MLYILLFIYIIYVYIHIYIYYILNMYVLLCILYLSSWLNVIKYMSTHKFKHLNLFEAVTDAIILCTRHKLHRMYCKLDLVCNQDKLDKGTGHRRKQTSILHDIHSTSNHYPRGLCTSSCNRNV